MVSGTGRFQGIHMKNQFHLFNNAKSDVKKLCAFHKDWFAPPCTCCCLINSMVRRQKEKLTISIAAIVIGAVANVWMLFCVNGVLLDPQKEHGHCHNNENGSTWGFITITSQNGIPRSDHHNNHNDMWMFITITKREMDIKIVGDGSRASLTVRITVKNGDPSGAGKIWENGFFTGKMDPHGAKRIQISAHTCLRYEIEKGLRAV